MSGTALGERGETPERVIDLADRCQRSGHFGWALALLSGLSAGPAQRPEALAVRARALAGLGRFQPALEAFEAALVGDPGNVRRWSELAGFYDSRDQPAAAFRVLELALVETGNVTFCWKLLARLKAQGARQPARAVAALAALHWPALAPQFERARRSMEADGSSR